MDIGIIRAARRWMQRLLDSRMPPPEPVTAAALEKALGPHQLWLAGYCNDVFGYLPSARVAAEGGYETRGLYAGGAGFFDTRAEQVVIQAVATLAKSAGR